MAWLRWLRTAALAVRSWAGCVPIQSHAEVYIFLLYGLRDPPGGLAASHAEEYIYIYIYTYIYIYIYIFLLYDLRDSPCVLDALAAHSCVGCAQLGWLRACSWVGCAQLHFRQRSNLCGLWLLLLEFGYDLIPWSNSIEIPTKVVEA